MLTRVSVGPWHRILPDCISHSPVLPSAGGHRPKEKVCLFFICFTIEKSNSLEKYVKSTYHLCLVHGRCSTSERVPM